MLSINKEQIAELPVAEFNGRIILIDNAADCRSAMKYLLKQDIVGFDTETRPTFRKGRPNKVALLQISTIDECFLFRLQHTGITADILKFFNDERVTKVGLSVKDDIHQMAAANESLTPRNVIELQTFVKDYQIADNALQKIYAVVFGERISKGQRLTNWEAERLTEQQQAYAALDAYACLRLYNHLTSGKFDPSKSPYQIPDEQQTNAL